MVERERGKYFLNRRDFTRSNGVPAPKKPDEPPIDNSKDQEVESKLKSLYDSLNTSFWDEKPKERKAKKPKAEKVKRERDYTGMASGYSTKAKSKLTDVYKTATATTRRRNASMGIVGIAGLLVVFGIIHNPVPTAGSITSVKGASTANIASAGFAPLLPGTADKHDSAAASIKYEPIKKVFSYNDSVGGTKGIIVSQQPLPDEYRKDPINGLLAIASNLGVSDWAASSKGKVFIGKNESGYGQTVVFTYKNILVLMRSSLAISQPEWKNYVDQLE